jgi:catalase
MVPGIAPSADLMLQARMFAYPDAARYRLGVNYQQLPCNAPESPVYSPYQRDGAFRYNTNYGGDPNYVNASLKAVNFKGSVGANKVSNGGHEEWIGGKVAGYNSEVTAEDFVQPRMFWQVLGRSGPNEQRDLVNNICSHLGKAIPRVQNDAVAVFAKVDAGLAEHIKKGLKL